jgi:DNA polymerase I-like protein with 3'-5' exonuclease and polymerase domains
MFQFLAKRVFLVSVASKYLCFMAKGVTANFRFRRRALNSAIILGISTSKTSTNYHITNKDFSPWLAEMGSVHLQPCM